MYIPDPLPQVAYFYTLGLYGSHLHGDQRGSTIRGHGRAAPDGELERRRRNQMTSAPAPKLTTGWRVRFFDEIMRVARTERFIVDALNVRTQHVHLLVFPLKFQRSWEIVRILKLRLTELAAEIPTLSQVERLWERGYGIGKAYTYGKWYGWFRYALYEQGSNTYLRKTKFAADKGLVFNPIETAPGRTIFEPPAGELAHAFCPEWAFSVRENVLQGLWGDSDEDFVWADDGEDV